MQALPHTHGCFVCGESNAIGLRLRFETDGTIVRTEFVPRPEHVGFRNVVHGGLVSTVLDEIMAWTCAVQTQQFGYCAEMNVRFLQPLRPGQLVIGTGKLEANRKNRIFEASARICDADGVLLAAATGKYLPLKPGEIAAFLPDLVGDLSMLRLKP